MPGSSTPRTCAANPFGHASRPRSDYPAGAMMRTRSAAHLTPSKRPLREPAAATTRMRSASASRFARSAQAPSPKTHCGVPPPPATTAELRRPQGVPAASRERPRENITRRASHSEQRPRPVGSVPLPVLSTPAEQEALQQLEHARAALKRSEEGKAAAKAEAADLRKQVRLLQEQLSSHSSATEVSAANAAQLDSERRRADAAEKEKAGLVAELERERQARKAAEKHAAAAAQQAEAAQCECSAQQKAAAEAEGRARDAEQQLAALRKELEALRTEAAQRTASLPPTIALMRHGIRADDGREIPPDLWGDRAQRPYDPPLAPGEEGRIEAAAQALAQRNVRLIASSPHRRCLQTAGLVARALKLPRVVVEPELQEYVVMARRCLREARLPEDTPMYFTRADAEAALGPGLTLKWPQGGDRLPALQQDDDITARVARAIPEIAARLHSSLQPPGGCVLMVTHGDLINNYLPELAPGVGIGAYRAQEAGFSLIREGESGFPPRVEDDAGIIASHGVERM
eukprot:TRINITY_DN2413_c0_g1_i1.p1 TRINITY_DN2413_c0_g1~~TRINITY_DN2413_c0_g1_i1.p1  ORF type:complete len:546 (+),score=124.15 TRINITY_DN2413_c0_g1_i1:85-1638(+)